MTDVKKARGSGRERIFRAAVEVLMESGLEAAQTRSVTERAGEGVPRGEASTTGGERGGGEDETTRRGRGDARGERVRVS